MKRIGIIASECQPFFASGGLADVIGSLPQRLLKIMKEEDSETEIFVMLPLYSKFTNESFKEKLE